MTSNVDVHTLGVYTVNGIQAIRTPLTGKVKCKVTIQRKTDGGLFPEETDLLVSSASFAEFEVGQNVELLVKKYYPPEAE